MTTCTHTTATMLTPLLHATVREFVEQLAGELFTATLRPAHIGSPLEALLPLFTLSTNKELLQIVGPRPGLNAAQLEQRLQMFEAAGRLAALSVIEGLPLGVRLPLMLLKEIQVSPWHHDCACACTQPSPSHSASLCTLQGEAVEWQDCGEVDETLVESLKFVLECDFDKTDGTCCGERWGCTMLTAHLHARLYDGLRVHLHSQQGSGTS